MRTLGIIIITAHAVIDAVIIGTFGWIMWTDHRDRRNTRTLTPDHILAKHGIGTK